MQSQQQYRRNESWGGGVTRRSRDLDNSADRIDGFRDKLGRPCAAVPHVEDQAVGEQGQPQVQVQVQLEEHEPLEEQVQLQEQPPSHQATPDDPKHGGHAAKQQPMRRLGKERADYQYGQQVQPEDQPPSLQATPIDPRLGRHAVMQQQGPRLQEQLGRERS